MTQMHDIIVDPICGRFLHHIKILGRTGKSIARIRIPRGHAVNCVAVLSTILTLAASIPTDIIVLDTDLGSEADRKMTGLFIFLLDALRLSGKPIALIGTPDNIGTMDFPWDFNGIVTIYRTFDDITRSLL